MGRPSRFSPEVRERAIRLVMEQRPAHPSEWAALQAVGGAMMPALLDEESIDTHR